MIRISSVQLTSQNNLTYNLTCITKAIASAADSGADLVVLPENACYMGKQADIAGEFARLCDQFSALAARHKIHLLAGTLPCPIRLDGQKDGKLRQSSLFFDANGALLKRYDKIHLFKAIVADTVGAYDESKTFVAGNELAVANCTINGQKLSIGMMICFDLRFPAQAQQLRLLGADILLAPSAFTFSTGKAHWQTLLQARALDAQCLVVGAAQGGMHKTAHHSRQTWGHSAIVASNGEVLANTGKTDVDNGYLLANADFDQAAQDTARQHLPIFSCMRPVDKLPSNQP